MTCVQITKCFLREITNLRVHLEVFATSYVSGATLHPGAIFDSEPRSVIWGSYHSEVFTSSGSSLLWDPPRSEDFNSKPEASTTEHLWSPPTVCSSILPTFITCNAPFSAGSYGQWQISRYAIPPTIASDHDRYNKFSTCRSYSYKSPSIPRLHVGIPVRYI